MQHDPPHEYPIQQQQQVGEFHNTTGWSLPESLASWRDLLARASGYWPGFVIKTWDSITAPYRTSHQHCDGGIGIKEEQVFFHYQVALSAGILLSIVTTLRACLLVSRSRNNKLFDTLSAFHVLFQLVLIAIRASSLPPFGETEQYSTTWWIALAEEAIHVNFVYLCSRFIVFQNHWDFILGVHLCCAIVISPDFVINYTYFRAISPLYLGMGLSALFVNLINKRSQ